MKPSLQLMEQLHETATTFYAKGNHESGSKKFPVLEKIDILWSKC
ncbi:hypothetical protein [Halobacillus mangrovi]